MLLQQLTLLAILTPTRGGWSNCSKSGEFGYFKCCSPRTIRAIVASGIADCRWNSDNGGRGVCKDSGKAICEDHKSCKDWARQYDDDICDPWPFWAGFLILAGMVFSIGLGITCCCQHCPGCPMYEARRRRMGQAASIPASTPETQLVPSAIPVAQAHPINIPMVQAVGVPVQQQVQGMPVAQGVPVAQA